MMEKTEVVPPTPDVDLLLECTFSYLHKTEDNDEEGQQPMEEQEDEYLSPLIQPEEDEDDEEEVVHCFISVRICSC